MEPKDHKPNMENKVAFSVFSQIDGKKYKVVVKQTDVATLSIEKIKKNLAKATKIPKEDQILFQNDQELENNAVGQDFGLCKDTNLILVSKEQKQRLLNFFKQHNVQPTSSEDSPSSASSSAPKSEQNVLPPQPLKPENKSIPEKENSHSDLLNNPQESEKTQQNFSTSDETNDESSKNKHTPSSKLVPPLKLEALNKRTEATKVQSSEGTKSSPKTDNATSEKSNKRIDSARATVDGISANKPSPRDVEKEIRQREIENYQKELEKQKELMRQKEIARQKEIERQKEQEIEEFEKQKELAIQQEIEREKEREREKSEQKKNQQMDLMKRIRKLAETREDSQTKNYEEDQKLTETAVPEEKIEPQQPPQNEEQKPAAVQPTPQKGFYPGSDIIERLNKNEREFDQLISRLSYLQKEDFNSSSYSNDKKKQSENEKEPEKTKIIPQKEIEKVKEIIPEKETEVTKAIPETTEKTLSARKKFIPPLELDKIRPNPEFSSDRIKETTATSTISEISLQKNEAEIKQPEKTIEKKTIESETQETSPSPTSESSISQRKLSNSGFSTKPSMVLSTPTKQESFFTESELSSLKKTLASTAKSSLSTPSTQSAAPTPISSLLATTSMLPTKKEGEITTIKSVSTLHTVLEKEREIVLRQYERKFKAKVEDEKAKFQRQLAQQKKEILRQANRDREELVVENQRLRNELHEAYLKLGNTEGQKALVEGQKLVLAEAVSADVSESIKRIEEDNKNLAKTIKRLENELLEKDKIIEDLSKKKADSQNSVQIDNLMEEIKEIKDEKKQWLQEKENILQNWSEEIEIMYYAYKNGSKLYETNLKQMYAKIGEQMDKEKKELLTDRKQLQEELENLTIQKLNVEGKMNDVVTQHDLEREAYSKELERLSNLNTVDKLFTRSSTKTVEVMQQKFMQHFSSSLLLKNETASLLGKLSKKQMVQEEERMNILLSDLFSQVAILQHRFDNLQQQNTVISEKLRLETKKRKRLHNAIEEMKGNIRVVIRIRPLLDGEKVSSVALGGKIEINGSSNFAGDDTGTKVLETSFSSKSNNVIGVRTASNGLKNYEFYRVLDEFVTQNELFEDEMKPLIQSAIDGFNVCVVAYGQTGSGKTFTIYGNELDTLIMTQQVNQPKEKMALTSSRGVVPRACEFLFELMQKNKIHHISVASSLGSKSQHGMPGSPATRITNNASKMFKSSNSTNSLNQNSPSAAAGASVPPAQQTTDSLINPENEAEVANAALIDPLSTAEDLIKGFNIKQKELLSNKQANSESMRRVLNGPSAAIDEISQESPSASPIPAIGNISKLSSLNINNNNNFSNFESKNQLSEVIQKIDNVENEEELENEGKISFFSMTCSMVELYLDQLYDLLDPDNPNKLELRHLPNGETYVQGLSVHEVETTEEILHLIAKGSSLREVHRTEMNDRSSRSHTIFTINLEIKEKMFQNSKGSAADRRKSVGGNEKSKSYLNPYSGDILTTRSKLVFVDLAGSERISKSHSKGQRFKEAQHINKSLSALGDVISALSTAPNSSFSGQQQQTMGSSPNTTQNLQQFTPYRNSKLTILLQNAIGGNSKTVMFCAVSPAASSISETQSTLLFASRVKRVQNPIQRFRKTLSMSQEK